MSRSVSPSTAASIRPWGVSGGVLVCEEEGDGDDEEEDEEEDGDEADDDGVPEPLAAPDAVLVGSGVPPRPEARSVDPAPVDPAPVDPADAPVDAGDDDCSGDPVAPDGDPADEFDEGLDEGLEALAAAEGTLSSEGAGGSISAGSTAKTTGSPANASKVRCTSESGPTARSHAAARADPVGPKRSGSAGRVSGTTMLTRNGDVTAEFCSCRALRAIPRMAEAAGPPSVTVTVIGKEARP
ncbi:hypothetical protein GCM10027572_21610 [Flexivirga lutea]